MCNGRGGSVGASVSPPLVPGTVVGWGRPESRRFEKFPACVWQGLECLQWMPFAINPSLFLTSLFPSVEGVILTLPRREYCVLGVKHLI